MPACALKQGKSIMSDKNNLLKKNQQVVINITDLNNLGYGVGHVENMTVFVSGAVDGETVLARIILVKKT